MYIACLLVQNSRIDGDNANPSSMHLRSCWILLLIVSVMVELTVDSTPEMLAQVAANYVFGERDRQRGLHILNSVQNDLKEHYYDPTFRGLDVEALFKKAGEGIKKAQSNNEIWEGIASVLMLLNDSHTRFIPPARMVTTNYGWDMKMVGEKCFVSLVEPGSDAEAKELRIGDQVLAIGDRIPTRDNLWLLDYLYDELRPMSGKHIIVQSSAQERRELDVMGKVKEAKLVAVKPSDKFENQEAWQEYDRWRILNEEWFQEIDGDILIWKMPSFLISERAVEDRIKRVRKHKALILDLRNNSGGYLDSLSAMLGYFFEHNVKIGQHRGRRGLKNLTASAKGDRVFKGELVVLVDSQSASAAEVFARVIQLEKRGTIVGDRTAGKVVASRSFEYCSISVFDLLLGDGGRLEHIGVVPDKVILPTGNDMASKRDPVLSQAASILGGTLDPGRAGALFPVDWSRMPK